MLARVFAARDVASAVQLQHDFQHLLPFHLLKNSHAAAVLLHQALAEQQRILIVGDFDADGATSCALAMRCLHALGAAHVDFLVPNRFEYGYGLTPEIVQVAMAYQPQLIVTVDNGIASIEGVAAAKAEGVRVLVTDHHLPGEQLPAADVIVNPNQPGDEFPSKNLAGVGVIFYVMLALRAYLRELDWFKQRGLAEPNLAQHLDLVALGTVADVVPLDHNNRILVSQGLARIRAHKCCPGIHALLTVARRELAHVTAADLGFAAGPRLNAAGRLEDMRYGIECLLQDDEGRALEHAQTLDQMNQDRRRIEADMQTQALAALEKLRTDAVPMGVCLYDAAWHQGVIGILASRIKDRLHRPVIAFADANERELKGSARSISGLHMRDALDRVATAQPDLLQKFGGHAMAAGLSILKEHLPRFQEAFDREVSRQLAPEDLQNVVRSDGELEAQYFSMELAQLIRYAAPWGQHFPEPVFDGDFRVVQQRVL
ncbi:MAG: single-stranded-DNA-specific exonuclease RecJ, partial [Nitrospira sp.]|nr:single-stranded-DNA-specific exonuclease RecJ [Nitrospira sp.]